MLAKRYLSLSLYIRLNGNQTCFQTANWSSCIAFLTYFLLLCCRMVAVYAGRRAARSIGKVTGHYQYLRWMVVRKTLWRWSTAPICCCCQHCLLLMSRCLLLLHRLVFGFIFWRDIQTLERVSSASLSRSVLRSVYQSFCRQGCQHVDAHCAIWVQL